jgi:ornithine cyclodeaminase
VQPARPPYRLEKIPTVFHSSAPKIDNMIHITEAQAKRALNVKSSLAILRRAYLQCNEGGIFNGPRLVMPVDNTDSKGQWLTANYPAEGFFGTKFSAVFPDNSKKGLPATISTISLYSNQTGELKAVIEANSLTALKTAGSAALATNLLSRKNSSTLAIIGTGLQAFDQVFAIREIRQIRRVIVYDTDSARAKHFIGLLRAVDGYDVATTASTSADEAVAEADVVCTCTTSHRPVFSGSSLRPGTHVNAIGSYAPDMQEIDTETVLRASCIITEHVDGLWTAAGDILDPFEKGLIDKSKVRGSIGDLLAGKVLGRKNADEITLYESVGSAVLDLAVAVETYRRVSGLVTTSANI